MKTLRAQIVVAVLISIAASVVVWILTFGLLPVCRPPTRNLVCQSQAVFGDLNPLV
jgi:hypothetical protein